MQRTTVLRLAWFIAVTLGVGLAIGALNTPGPWYASLAKPSFNPPNWLFAPAWTVLYVLIAIAGERVSRAGWQTPAPQLWVAQLCLNFLWPPVFFSLQDIRLALAVISMLLLAILGFVVTTWRGSPRGQPLPSLWSLGGLRGRPQLVDLAAQSIIVRTIADEASHNSTDAEPKPSDRDWVDGTGLYGHVERVLVTHVDDEPLGGTGFCRSEIPLPPVAQTVGLV